MNLEWLLSQVSSYVNHFSKALTAPESLLDSGTDPTEKNITEAMIFLALSLGIGAVGFDFIVSRPTSFPKDLVLTILIPVLLTIMSGLETFLSWWLAGSRLPFQLYLRGIAYYTGVCQVLGMLACSVFLGILAPLRSGALAQARLAIWTVFMNQIEIRSEAFPDNWADLSVLGIFFFVNLLYLLLVWWPTYRRLSKLGWAHGAWAFLNLAACRIIVNNLVLVLAILSTQ